MATSTIPSFKVALLALLDAALPTVQVSWGWPGRTAARDMVILGDVPDWDQEPAAMRAGRKPREESYVAHVLIRVERSGFDQKTATERAFALAEAVEDAIGNDPTVGGVVRDAEFRGGSLEEMAAPGGDGRTALLTLHISVDARI